MNPDEFCTSDQWSMLTSASSNPQHAGVLGGFLITAIAWTQRAVSTGKLAAGATALFGGLGWMLASHAVNKMSNDDPDDGDDIRAYSFLADLGGGLTFAAAMTTTLILSETPHAKRHGDELACGPTVCKRRRNPLRALGHR